MPQMHGKNMTGTSSAASSSVAMNQVERVNGWSCPWHPLQFIAWFFLIFFAVVYYGTFVPHLSLEWRPAGYIIPGGIYVIHVIFHVLALSVDPADPNIRGSFLKRDKAQFDRSLHRHVIENSHCYICQSDVGSGSKHCSVCNKCVAEFDHHCKWLNNCVGGRNYKLFIGCVASAFVEALLVFTVTLYLVVAYFADIIVLKKNAGGQLKLFVPVPDTAFVVFVVIIAAMLLLALALLGHLLGFHIYLMCHRISTYDFIVNQRELKAHHDDVESGRSNSTPIFKLKNNKVKPVIEVTDENGRKKSGEGTQSEVSVETPSKETSVKTIREVSSKASKNYRSYAGTELDSTRYDDSTRNKQEGDDNILHASSSEESLKEIPYQPTPPQVVVLQPDGSGPSTSSRLVSESQVSEDSRSPGKREKPQQVVIDIANENIENSPSEDISNAAGPSTIEGVVKKKKKKRTVPREGELGQESDRLTPRRKKKKKPKPPAGEGELPPLVLTGRPLPSLPSELVKEESPC